MEKQFRVALQALEAKYKYTTLFSDLVTERSLQVLDSSDYENVGRQEMQDQRKEWESLVFSPLPLDEAKILSTLGQVFSGPEAEEMVEQTTEMKSLIAKIVRREGINLRDPYWFAIVELYGEEMKEVFGSLQVVERGLLPMGMVELFKSRVRWDA